MTSSVDEAGHFRASNLLNLRRLIDNCRRTLVLLVGRVDANDPLRTRGIALLARRQRDHQSKQQQQNGEGIQLNKLRLKRNRCFKVVEVELERDLGEV